MTTNELRNEIEKLVAKCDDSNQQQAIKSVLVSVLAASFQGVELQLMMHVSEFTGQTAAVPTSQAGYQPENDWPDVIG